jgi:predicted neutral ceramidase superfamily lipid hydrolase
MGVWWKKIPFLLASITVAFIVAGIVINCLQLLAYLLIRPFSLNGFRIINSFLVEYLWLSTLLTRETNLNVIVVSCQGRRTLRALLRRSEKASGPHLAVRRSNALPELAFSVGDSIDMHCP